MAKKRHMRVWWCEKPWWLVDAQRWAIYLYLGKLANTTQPTTPPPQQANHWELRLVRRHSLYQYLSRLIWRVRTEFYLCVGPFGRAACLCHCGTDQWPPDWSHFERVGQQSSSMAKWHTPFVPVQNAMMAFEKKNLTKSAILRIRSNYVPN
jgi:hypothetical protein